MSQGYQLYQPGDSRWPASWEHGLSRQTLQPGSRQHDFTLTAWKLAEGSVDIPDNLLERMAWGLWARPDASVVVQPLHLSLRGGAPSCLEVCPPAWSATLLSSGGVALWNPGVREAIGVQATPEEMLQVAVSKGYKILVSTQALLEEQERFLLPVSGKQKVVALIDEWEKRLIRRFSGSRYQWIPALLRYALNLAQLTADLVFKPRCAEPVLAGMKEWPPAIAAPLLSVRSVPADARIRVLVAMHWLELGGAEKFALDLIRNLPKEDYAVHVVTDVPSLNSWETRIADQVEEIIHLPSFLTRPSGSLFLEQLVRTRRINILHIHHSAWAYESLFHLRRFHPELVIIDSLHIIELPPSGGGYPEYACARFEAFIDSHHVITDQLGRYLRQRWGVPESKIERIYLNVDVHYFNPEAIPLGTFRREWSLPTTATVVGFVGRFVQQKQPLVFVEMAARLLRRGHDERLAEPLCFVMVGQGILEPLIRKRIKALGLEGRIILTGELRDTRSLYRDASVVVLSSENEGLALVAYEAMAMGAVVVSTDVGGQSELLTADCLVPSSGDVAESLDIAVWPYLVDPGMRRDKGIGNRDAIVRCHQADATFVAIRKLYAKLMVEKSTGSLPRA